MPQYFANIVEKNSVKLLPGMHKSLKLQIRAKIMFQKFAHIILFVLWHVVYLIKSRVIS